MAHEISPANLEHHQGALYSFERDGSVIKHKDKVSISNGLAWTADNKTMYYIDSIPRKVWAYDFELTTGTMSKFRFIHYNLASVAQLDAPSDWRPGGRGFNPLRDRQHSFVEIDHEIFSTVILSLPLIQEGQLSVSGERMRTILVNPLED